MKNMIETGKCNFDMEFWPLLRKKIIIEDVQMQGVRTFTDRETDGALTKQEKKQVQGFVYKTMDKLASKAETSANTHISGFKGKMNIDSVMSLIDIRSIKKMDSLKSALADTYQKWDNKLSESNIESDIKKIESGIKSIEPKKIDNISELQKALKTAEDIKKRAEKLQSEFKDTKKNFVRDFNQAQKSLSQVDEWIEEDYRRARAKAKLPDISAGNIGMLIFGQEAVYRFNKYLGYAGTARSFASKLKSDKPEKKKPPRLKGQDIPFPDKNARPDFWIKKINLSGETNDNLVLTGDIYNITDNQKFIDKPTEVKLSGNSKSGARMEINAMFDYRTEEPLDSYDVNYTGFSLANTQLSKSNLLPNKVKSGMGNVYTSLKLKGQNIDGQIKFLGEKLKFEFKKNTPPKNTLDRIIHDVIEGIKNVDFIAYISGSGDNLNFRISSNLDEAFSKGLKASVSKEIAAARQKIEQRINKEVSKYRAQLNDFVNAKEGKLKAEINKYQKQVDEQTTKVEEKRKEIEQQIADEKKKLEKKAKNKLKDLFN
jgi:uncharacterized protein (TIGR03545 family)